MLPQPGPPARGVDPLPSDAWAAAVTAAWGPAESETEQQRDAVALAARLAEAGALAGRQAGDLESEGEPR